MGISGGLLADKLHGQTKVTDDAGVVVTDENILTLQVSVCDGRLLGDPINYPLIMEMSQSYGLR